MWYVVNSLVYSLTVYGYIHTGFFFVSATVYRDTAKQGE